MCLWALVYRFNYLSGMAVVTPTERPKSVRYRCVIEVFGGDFCDVTLPFGFLCVWRGFCHKTESDLFLFSSMLLSIAFRRPLPVVLQRTSNGNVT